jgi:hypothetical protein
LSSVIPAVTSGIPKAHGLVDAAIAAIGDQYVRAGQQPFERQTVVLTSDEITKGLDPVVKKLRVQAKEQGLRYWVHRT